MTDSARSGNPAATLGSRRSESARLVQITQRTLRVDRLPIGSKPVFEALLEPHERIIGVAHANWIGGPMRKTEDHYVTVWIEADMGGDDDV